MMYFTIMRIYIVCFFCKCIHLNTMNSFLFTFLFVFLFVFTFIFKSNCEFLGNFFIDLFGDVKNTTCFLNTCYYFSTEKISWHMAEKLCKLLVIKTFDEYEFIREKIIKIRNDEQESDQLVFNIGFNKSEFEWKWLDNSSFISDPIALHYFNDLNLGVCGTIVVDEENQVILRSGSCGTQRRRFICSKVLNPCNNNVCGKDEKCIYNGTKFSCLNVCSNITCQNYGQCSNFFGIPKCKCTFFYKGKYCKEYNSFIILIIVCFIVFIFLVILFIFISRFLIKKNYIKIIN